jgi:hypothetical protein
MNKRRRSPSPTLSLFSHLSGASNANLCVQANEATLIQGQDDLKKSLEMFGADGRMIRWKGTTTKDADEEIWIDR